MSTNLGQLAAGMRGIGGLAGMAAGSNPGGYGGALSSLGNVAGGAANGLGVLSGLQRGGVGGYGSAAVNAGQLAGKSGVFGPQSSGFNQGVGDAANVLGIYNGIKQGGVGGYGGAAVNAAQLGSRAGAFGSASGAIGSAAGYAAIPLALYNEINNWKSGATTSDALAGASTGAAIGSVVPGIGTLIGGVVGGAAGALSSLAGPGRTDPETTGVQQLIDATGKYGNTQQIAQSVNNPYLELAGLMDERSSTLPEYQKYGRMGEQKFSQDLATQINDALTTGIASGPNAGDRFVKDSSGNYNLVTPTGGKSVVQPGTLDQAVYGAVVNPWVEGMGSGSKNVGATYNATNQGLLKDLTSQYLSGNAANDWKAIGGDSPFTNIYQNSPISAAPAPMTQSQISQAGNQMGARSKSNAKMADGGRAKRKSILDSIRPSFKDAPKTHYNDGGSYVSYSNPSGPALDFNSLGSGGSGNAFTDYSNQNLGDIQTQLNQDQQTNQALGDWLVNYENTAPPASGGTSGKSGAGGLSGLAKSAAPYAALVPLLGALAGKVSGSGSSGGASLPAGQSTGPTGPFQAQASPRTANAIDPNTDWYKYGQHPETQFFSNNSIAPLMGKFVAPQASQPTPGGGMNTQPVTAPGPALKAQGGALGSLEDGTPVDPGPGESRHVRGPGDGTSDDIDAKLSDGEYVIDANTVSMLGNGSNEAGAKRLDQLRENLRKHAAKPMAKGKQFMKAKAPEAYMRGGK